MYEYPSTFAEIVEPLRADFSIDPETGWLDNRRARSVNWCIRGLAAIGFMHGALQVPHSLVTAPPGA